MFRAKSEAYRALSNLADDECYPGMQARLRKVQFEDYTGKDSAKILVTDLYRPRQRVRAWGSL